jgi:hypothetical protein
MTLSTIPLSKTHLASLAEELQLLILSFLQANELTKTCKVSILFKKISDSNFLWIPLTRRKCADITVHLDPIKDTYLGWKQAFITVDKAEKIRKEKLNQKLKPSFDVTPYRYSIYFLEYTVDPII